MRTASGLFAEEAGNVYVQYESKSHRTSKSQLTEDISEGKTKTLHGTEMDSGVVLHPTARKLFARVPFVRYIPILGEIIESYGPNSVFAFALVQFSCKGLADALVQNSINPMYSKYYKSRIEVQQRAQGILFLGWSIKVFPALISDTIAIAKFKKRWYLVFGALAAAIFALAMALLPPVPSSAVVATGFLFLTCFGKSLVDVLTEGHYSRMMRKSPRAGPSLVSWIWIFILLGGTIGSCIGGPINDAKLYLVNLYVSAGFAFLAVLPLIFNLYGEQVNKVERLEDARTLALTDAHQKQQQAKYNALSVGELPAEKEQIDDGFEFSPPKSYLWGFIEVNTEVLYRNWRVVILGFLVLIMVCGLCTANILDSLWGLVSACVAAGVVLNLGCFLSLPLPIAKANLYMFIQFSAYLQFQQPLRSFYLASNECVPNGPHFTYTFYDTIGGVIGNFVGVAAVSLVPFFFTNRSYRLIIVFTSSLQVLSSIFDLIIFERWNRPYVSDHVVYILGDAIVSQTCYMLYFLPTTILMSRLCPRGLESVVYALLAGMSNMGQYLSNAISSIFLETIWKISVPESGLCDFKNLKWLIILGHFLLPMVILPLVLLLIPSANLSDELDRDGKPIRESDQD